MPRLRATRFLVFVALRTLVVALLAVFVVCVPAGAAPLTGASITLRPGGGAIMSLSFAGVAPRPQIAGNGTANPTIVLANTTVSQTVPPALAGQGPIVSAAISQTGSQVRVSLNLAAPAAITVRPAGSTVFIDVAPAGPQAAATPAFGSEAALPQTMPVAPGLQQTIVVPLKYADVSEIAGVLVAGSNVPSNDNFVPQQSNIGTSSLGTSFGGGGGFGSGGFNAPAPAQSFGGNSFGQVQSVAQRLSDNVAIDRRLNAVILTGTPDVIAALRDTIDKLDVQVPSVLLETQIVELTDTAARNIGLDFSPTGSGVIINGTGNGSSSGAGSAGFISQTGMFPSGQLSMSANLYAQISEGNGRVIATPRILAQSGQPASILTGDALPITTNIVVAGASSAIGQQVNYVNVGVNLQIQPRVSSDGYVTSHIYSEVSSVTGYITGNIPQISQRTASTIATVRDGQAIVIGGLLQDNEIRNLTRLPFISDIPLIGSFFKHISTTKTQANLYIIVTPHIVPIGGTTAPPPTGVPLNRPAPLPQATPPPAPTTPSPAVHPRALRHSF